MDNSPGRIPLISVIVPALNEADRIAATLEDLNGKSGLEVIVVDGGSSDDTKAQAWTAGAKVIEAAGGKAGQMNAGARVAKGEILLFLHADTRLPPGFAEQVREALHRPGVAAGAFMLTINAPGTGFRWIERLAHWRCRLFSMPYGDQALFMTAAMFGRLGGFPALPIMEDFELVRRLRRRGDLVLLSQSVVTSARRWQQRGLMRTTLINQAVILGYLLGISPTRLARWYRIGTGKKKGYS